jgi:hypothetical protein
MPSTRSCGAGWLVSRATAPGCRSLQQEGVYSSIVARVAQITVWAVILVLGVLAYWRYLELAPMD